MGRLYAIGDIHGCWQELDLMLNHLSPAKDDRVLLMGDLVNRGPDSKRVLEIARHVKALALLGNHEVRLLAYQSLRDPDMLKPYDWITLSALGDDEWDYMHQMKRYHYEPAHDTIFVHGGFMPNVPWRQQTISTVTRIQVVTQEGEPAKRSEAPDGTPWYTLWPGPSFVVYGHTPRASIVRTNLTLGLDTGCVHGNYLTCYSLPSKEIIQVRSRRAYWPRTLK